ncbi:MAG: molybdate ABC transporter substrate-binding protein, partial [Alphaproteobacteria bacterium]
MRIGAMAALLAVVALVAVPAPAAAQSGDVIVFAAASMKNALDDVAAAWQRGGGRPVKLSYAASSALARQIEQGAPASIFISADLDWMDHVAQRGLIRPGTRTSLLGNRIVLIAPAGSAVAARIAPGFDLAGLLSGGRLAMADTRAVP